MTRPRNLTVDLLLGAAAGIAATWVMGRVSTALYETENEEARASEDDVRGGKTAYAVAAEKAGDALGVEVGDEERARYGRTIHWGLGAGAGALYGIFRSRTEWASVGFGTLYGTLFFLVVDEGLNPLLRLTPPPQDFPLQTHGRGLASHQIFGVATETILRLADEL